MLMMDASVKYEAKSFVELDEDQVRGEGWGLKDSRNRIDLGEVSQIMSLDKHLDNKSPYWQERNLENQWKPSQGWIVYTYSGTKFINLIQQCLVV